MEVIRNLPSGSNIIISIRFFTSHEESTMQGETQHPIPLIQAESGQASESASWMSPLGQWQRWWKLALALGAPISAFIGLVMIFVYLVHIGRPELLLQVVSMPSGLTLIVAWALIVLLSLGIMFFSSLWLIDIAAAQYGDKPIPPAMPGLLAVGVVVWLVVATLIFRVHYLNEHVLFAVAIYSCLLIIAGALIQHRALPAGQHGRKQHFAAIGTGIFVGTLFSLAMVFSLYAPLAFVTVEPAFGQRKVDLFSAAILAATSVPTLFLGWVLFWDVAKRRSLSDARKKAIFSVLLLVVVGLMAAFRPFDMQVLRGLGVYSTGPVQFAVAADNLTPTLKAAGFRVVTEQDGAEVFNAVVNFHFGDLLVLCSPHEGASPLSTLVSESKTSVLKDGPSLSSPPQNKVPRTYQRPCLDLHTDDVRRLSSMAVHAKPKAPA